MSVPLSRRRFLAALGAGLAVPALLGAASVPGSSDVEDETLLDEGESFRMGSRRGVELSPSPSGLALQATQDNASFVSRTLQATRRFTHVGVHWEAMVPPGTSLRFMLRTNSGGSDWSPWRELQIERTPEETVSGEWFAALGYSPIGRAAQYHVTFHTAGRVSPSLQSVRVTLISSPTRPQAANVAAAVTVADAASGRSLAVTAREQWGADERLRLNKRGGEIWPEMLVPTKKLVIHHTATRNDYGSGAEAAADVRAIYRYHAVTQRWGDIGYQALVDRFGNVYEGRHGRGDGSALSTPTGREVLSAGVVAGHDYAHNYGSDGVALLGDATRTDWPLQGSSGPMWDALVRWCTFEAGRHFLRPLRSGVTQGAEADAFASDFLRSDDLWTAAMRSVSGHRDTSATLCPGDPVVALLPSLRNAISTGLIGASRTGLSLANTAPGGRDARVGTAIRYSWTLEPPESGWSLVGYEQCVEGWSKVSKSDAVTYLSGFSTEAQPRQLWTSVGTASSASFTPAKPGHYTFHVRALLRNAAGERRAAYAANHTFLVQ